MLLVQLSPTPEVFWGQKTPWGMTRGQMFFRIVLVGSVFGSDAIASLRLASLFCTICMLIIFAGFRKYLPVLDQHLLPDDFAHDLRADAEQLGDGGVRVVEANQQNL